jgi:crossover junction endodeoxyribonuclease RuvC
MIVLGCDPSTKTGLVRFEDDETYTSVLRSLEKKGISRVSSLGFLFEQYLDEHPDIDCAVIEGYAYANQHTLAILVEIGVTMRLALYRRKVPCYIAPPSVLKKYATGKGNSKKPEVASAVRERWGFENPSDDVVDAYVLAKIAQDMASGSQAVAGIELLV